jgi:uncharacterized protein YecE (DUF72 family)
MNLHVGTSGFAYKEWKGTFYPKDLPAARMLQFYGEQFPAVEINTTFYHPPKPDLVSAWAGEVPATFKFAIKVPQQITHRRQLAKAGEVMDNLLDVVKVLKKRLGPLLFQLPPWLKKDSARLRELLALPPPRQRAAVEFRHPSWFDEETFTILREHNAALCVAEAEDDLNVPFVATADWGYLRLRRLDYGESELKAWAQRVRGQKWQEACVFFRHEDTAKGPAFARRFLELASPRV